MSADGTYLAVFLSNKDGPRWKAWYAMSEAERRAADEIGIPALHAWDEKHKDAIVYSGGPLGKTRQVSPDGVVDAVNEMTAFVVVRAPSHEAAARMFEDHPAARRRYRRRRPAGLQGLGVLARAYPWSTGWRPVPADRSRRPSAVPSPAP